MEICGAHFTFKLGSWCPPHTEHTRAFRACPVVTSCPVPTLEGCYHVLSETYNSGLQPAASANTYPPNDDVAPCGRKAMSGVNNVISTWWGPLYRLVKLMYHWRDSSRWILKKSQTSKLLGSLSCYLAWNRVLTFWFYLAFLSLSLNPIFLVK